MVNIGSLGEGGGEMEGATKEKVPIECGRSRERKAGKNISSF